MERMARRRVTRYVRLLALAALAAVATPSHSVAFPLPEPQTHAAQPEPVCVTPTRAGVRSLVREFVDAYNAGDVERLDALVAKEDDFQWYFVQGERQRDAHERTTLPAYFAQRHVMDDRLRLVELGVRRDAGWHGGYDFAMRLRRWSQDDAARGMWHGKGAADCAIFVWSLGKE
jgi:hypothetical protein